MGGPQLEHGYLRIANELFDALTRFPFSKRQYKVLLYIIRKTYGFGKKQDDMTVTQIANGTGLTRPHASGTLHELVEMGAVLKRDGHHGYLVGINKNYGQWIPSQNGTCPKTGNTPSQNRTETVPKRDTQKTTPKDNSKRQGASKLPPWLPEDAWKEFVAYRRKKAPLTDRAKALAISKLDKLRQEGHDPAAVIDQSILNGWRGLFPVKDGDTAPAKPQSEFDRCQRRAKELGAETFKGWGTETHEQFIDRIKRMDREAA